MRIGRGFGALTGALWLVVVGGCSDDTGDGGTGGSAGEAPSGGAGVGGSSSNSSSGGNPTAGGNGQGGEVPQVCTPNEMVACYSGTPGTEGMGICKAGVKTCNALGTEFGACDGEVVNVGEDCETAEDEDCDGVGFGDVDSGCTCEPLATDVCYTGTPGTENVGPCKSGTKTCSPDGLVWGNCVGEVIPATEDCATAEDEDCNGVGFGDNLNGCACEPNITDICYTGPTGTFNVGQCKNGLHKCNPLGTAFGPCQGEVLPSAEQCATPEDESCEGDPACSGTFNIGKLFGDATAESTGDVAVAPDGSIYIVGRFSGTIDFGAGAHTAVGVGSDMFVAKFFPTGGVEWSLAFSSSQSVDARSIDVDSSGNAYVYGAYTGSLDFGVGGHTSLGTSDDSYVLKLDPTGAPIWSRSIGGTLGELPRSLTVDANNNVVVVGQTLGAIDFGTGPQLGGGNLDGYIAKLDSSGNTLWGDVFGDANDQWFLDVATDSNSNIYFVGWFAGSLNVGGTTLLSAGKDDAFIAKYAPDGSHIWSKSYGDSSWQDLWSVAVDGSGNVIVGGRNMGTMTFGSTVLISAGGFDSVLAKVDSSGNAIWAKGAGDAANQEAPIVAADSADNILFTTRLVGTADFGGGLVISAGSGDVYVEKQNAAGTSMWRKRSGDGSDQAGRAVAAGRGGQAYVVGEVAGLIDFGGGALASAGSQDVFLLAYWP